MQHSDIAGNQIPPAGQKLTFRRICFVAAVIFLFYASLPVRNAYAAADPAYCNALNTWAKGQVGVPWSDTGCLAWVSSGLVAIGYPEPMGIATAADFYHAWINGGYTPAPKKWGDGTPAAGDVLFYDAYQCIPTGIGYAGHIAIYAGNGMVYTNGFGGRITIQPINAMCYNGNLPTAYLPCSADSGGGGQQCPPTEANLTNAIALAKWGVHVNVYSQGDRACSACTSQYPNGMPGAPAGPPSKTGYCCSYDCSSFATWILRQIPQSVAAGVAPAPAWPYVTTNFWSWANGGSLNSTLSSGAHLPTTAKPCDPTQQPICLGETMWNETPGPGHIVTALCGHIYGADCPGCGPDITDNYAPIQPGYTEGSGNTEIVWITPPGLDNITMASCSAQCTNGTGGTTCTSSGGGGPAPTGGAGGCSNGTMGGSASCQGGGSCGGNCKFCVGDYFQGIGSFESNCSYTISNPFGCLGKYQFCPGTIQSYWANCPSDAQWLASPACQDQAAVKYAQGNWSAFSSGFKSCLCKQMTAHNGTQFTMTQGAVLGGGQFGIGWVEDLCNGQDHTDGNGFYESDYAARMSTTSVNSNIPWAYNSCGAQPPPPGGGGGTCGPPPCGLPQLTGTWQDDPCSITPPSQPAGQKFHDMLDNWWQKNFEPAIKDMTTQLYAYRVFQTQQLGRIMDAEDVANAARTAQEQHITTSEDDLANDLTCVAGSFSAAATETRRTSTALMQGFKNDLQWRAQNVTEKSPTGLPVNMTPWTDQNARWASFCKEFYDPKSNDGKNVTSKGQGICPNPTTPGAIVNGDISIENFLMQDTIDLNNLDQYKAAQALMINLLQPSTEERLPANLLPANGNVPTSVQEHIIRRQHLDAINNIAADVIGSMISRRAAMSPTTSDPAALSAATEIQEIRKRAGVDPKQISPTPSYNEIMEAMTKERFFDPEYFFRVNNTEGAIKQEQASVDAYTTVEMQDIYQMEEQINALLAARASLKLSTDANKNQSSQAPNK